MKDDELEKKVLEFPTKNVEGFTYSEIQLLLKNYPSINHEKFNEALMGITGLLIDGEFITYHGDVLLALRCGLENRSPTSFEWD